MRIPVETLASLNNHQTCNKKERMIVFRSFLQLLLTNNPFPSYKSLPSFALSNLVSCFLHPPESAFCTRQKLEIKQLPTELCNEEQRAVATCTFSIGGCFGFDRLQTYHNIPPGNLSVCVPNRCRDRAENHLCFCDAPSSLSFTGCARSCFIFSIV